MQVDAFWKHWQVREDPFRAEEAREDPVFRRLIHTDTTHPDFAKIFGQPDRPTTAVVFGEKGSGKTALRLTLETRLAEHNAKNPERKAWVVRYDDLNAVLDRFAHAHHAEGEKLLNQFRLADHQDAILSLVITRLVDALLHEGGEGSEPLGGKAMKIARKMGRTRRADLALLAALYDQPRTGSFARRWPRLRKALRIALWPAMSAAKWIGGLLAVLVIGLVVAERLGKQTSSLNTVLTGVCTAGAILLLGYWLIRTAKMWSLAGRIRREIHVVDRTRGELRHALGDLSGRELAATPLPMSGDQDCRYQLTSRLLNVIGAFGYRGLVVLVDRVDEPAMVNGDAKKMKALIWPMLNNKFLQQDSVGIKLLLPVELRHMLGREESEFYQRARLDKQHMVDRLVWSGATLYDLCSSRLAACTDNGQQAASLMQLFDDDVTRQDLIDALDQMQQPRDAFKFLYRVIQEHCSNVPQDEPRWRIPRLTLQQVRKQQSQRVQDLQRGVTPA
ncbi:MAG: hypothetical protein GC162_11290 [Planctomycetes bacterium]|nr:hypothetical protein [Planctomycetota bacterium]